VELIAKKRPGTGDRRESAAAKPETVTSLGCVRRQPTSHSLHASSALPDPRQLGLSQGSSSALAAVAPPSVALELRRAAVESARVVDASRRGSSTPRPVACLFPKRLDARLERRQRCLRWRCCALLFLVQLECEVPHHEETNVQPDTGRLLRLRRLISHCWPPFFMTPRVIHAIITH